MNNYLVTDLEAILGQIDLLISKHQSEEVEANLYSARMHINRAIREEKQVREAA